MTGELCDCFHTKAEGVRSILAAVRHAAAARDVRVYLTGGGFASLERAPESPQMAAASNWRALAEYVVRYTERQPGLLIDIGSTTTDIVPLVDGRAQPLGLTDTDRLIAGELVYTGVGRTPVCAVTRSLPWHGKDCPVAAELFATTADVYVLLGDLHEHPNVVSTADGRPLTAEFARDRLARMICADGTALTYDDARKVAEFVRDTQLTQLRTAAEQVMNLITAPPRCVVMSGTGEFLARHLVNDLLPSCRAISLADRLGKQVSACAPAHALAVLAAEEFGP
jgi:hypothetical protein